MPKGGSVHYDGCYIGEDKITSSILLCENMFAGVYIEDNSGKEQGEGRRGKEGRRGRGGRGQERVMEGDKFNLY